MEDLNEMMKVRREKMEEFRAMGVPPFGHRYEVTDYAEPIKEKYAHLEGDEEGGEVRIAGRLMAIADVYDALRSRRVYKGPMTHEEATAIILRDSGRHFDPRLATIFGAIHEDFRRVAEAFPEE